MVTNFCTFRSGNENVINLLLEISKDVNVKDNEGRTALMEAVDYGMEKVVKNLLEKSADVNAKDNYGLTALIEAARWDDGKIVELLLEKSAEVNLNLSLSIHQIKKLLSFLAS